MAVNTQGFGIQLATGGFSLEANTVFSSYAAALAYAQSSAAYLGKVISVTEGDDKGVYVLEAIGETASLKKVGDIDLTNYVTKDQLTNIYTYKGSKPTYADLPTEGNAIGDVWNVEAAYTSTVDNKNYAAGTNWVWNGTEWDAQGGSVDLSAYATTESLNTAIVGVNQNIASNLGEINSLKTAVSTKVEQVEGSSLITSEKLTLIDTNATDIAALKLAIGLNPDGTPGEDASLETRVGAAEASIQALQGKDTELSGLITANDTAIKALQTDNATNKQDISDLKGEAAKIAGIIELNTQQTGQIAGLTTSLGEVDGRVSKAEGDIVSLNTTVGGHTTAIGELQTLTQSLSIKSVATGENVIVNNGGVLSTTLGLDSYQKEVNGVSKTYVKLTGIEGAIISEFDASAFVKDGMINAVDYDTTKKVMTITWNTDAGLDKVEIPMSGLVDTYIADEQSLTVSNNTFSAKISKSTNNKLSVSTDGLLVDISADIAALEGTMDSKIESAFEWENVDVEF